MSTLIPAFCKGPDLKKQIQEVKRNGTVTAFDVWWLGQSGFLLQWNRSCLLFDPYLSDSLTMKYAMTDKPHVRMSELVIAPSLMDNIDIVTSSHNHTDHLDGETLIPLLKVNPHISLVIPEANRDFVADRVGCDPGFPVGLTDGASTQLKGFTIHGVPAAHNSLERDEQGHCKFMGFVVRFGKFCVYHSGDTRWFEGLDWAAEVHVRVREVGHVLFGEVFIRPREGVGDLPRLAREARDEALRSSWRLHDLTVTLLDRLDPAPSGTDGPIKAFPVKQGDRLVS